MNKNSNTAELTTQPQWVRGQFLRVFAVILFMALGFYGLSLMMGEGTQAVSIGLGILIVLPYGLGGLAALLMNPSGEKSGTATLAVIGMIFLVLLLGSIILREGVICIIMLAPLWILSAFLGAFTVSKFHAKFHHKNTLSSSLFAALPLLALFLDSYIPQETEIYTVTRTINIEAAADDIWPHLIELNGLTEDDGRWNFTQNILGIPRPASANVIGTGTNAVRKAQWRENISFEEHITTWAENDRLEWMFVFPNDSVHAYTDRHISPDGRHLKIKSGGYALESRDASHVTLTLMTDYAATTPLNFYSALWGELILGDLQNNILKIVKDRVEGS
ncbi:MAG: hypothetical protein ACSHX3_02715 [Litorimonas sp.]